MLHVPTATTLGDLLLALYEAARTPAVNAFQEKALAAISRTVPFDASIWGIGTVSWDQTIVKGAHLWNFEEETVDFLNREDSRNIVGKAIREQPGKAHIFSAEKVFSDPQTEFIWKNLGGVKHVLCHGAIDPNAGLISFFALARRSGTAPFTQEDAQWVEILAPHLEATLQLCRVSELQQYKDGKEAHHTRRGVCDACGVLHVAEPGFATLLQEGWPRWRGPHLPPELNEIVASSECRTVQQGDIHVSVSGTAQQRIVTVSRTLPIDRLTPRERAVAEPYAEGLSHKEVARLLKRSPATVRHHLRSVYAKLGVKDKGALAHAISDQGAPADSRDTPA